MSAKPAGVFVRLPLSADDVRKMDIAIARSWITQAKPAQEKCAEDGILALGTPVTGKNLDCAVIIEQDDKRYMPEVVSYQPHLVKPKQILFLVRQSDAQAQIAALEAEVVRLREYYEAFQAINKVGILEATPQMYVRERLAREAL